jgi:16S rRNA processing protein RimM
MGASDWVLLARLIRPQGRKGELLADLLTDFPERFAERRNVFLRAASKNNSPNLRVPEPRAIEVENHWLHKGRVVLKFIGIDSINDAELLRGMEVVIPPEERAPLADDEVYIADLLNCVVYDHDSEVGRISDVDMESTAGALLVVKQANGNEVLIPFVKAYLQRVDVAAKRIEMKLPQGLLEVNSPLSAEERRAFESDQAGAEK